MDKKAKKKLEVLRQRMQKLQQRLAGARQQDDDPGEVEELEQQLAETRAEIDKLRDS